MPLAQVINEIRGQIATGHFRNEAAVKHGIVLRILNELGWPVFDAQVVYPEYPLDVRRVDFALCHPRATPRLLVEAKDIGNAGGAERQLFEYAFHRGIPMAVLTDGQEWSFFLPGEQGDYQERCVYKLDLLARPVEESIKIFQRYLAYSEVCSGHALQAARDDYQNVSRERAIQHALPQAWRSLLEEEDELLLELLADKVQTITGFKPSPDTVADFVLRLTVTPPQGRAPVSARPTDPPTPTAAPAPAAPRKPSNRVREFVSARIQDRAITGRSAKDVMIGVLGDFQHHDPSFLDRFASLPRHGRRRRYISKNKSELYPGRPDLCEDCSEQHFGDWWVGTNYSRSTLAKIIEMAAEVAGLKFGRDVVLE